jgi:thiamine pyridinylase
MESTSMLKGLVDESYAVVEVDGVMLGTLVSDQRIGPWSTAVASDWHPAAATASRLGETVYGVPHWMCGYFVFARDPRVTNAATSEGLVQALRNVPGTRPDIAGNLRSSWDLSMMYLDSWLDDRPSDPLSSALGLPPQPEVVRNLVRLREACDRGGTNPCASGTYRDNHQAADEFGRNEVDAMFGYSERLHWVLRADPEGHEVRVSSLPLGRTRVPGVYVDMLVRSATCTGTCSAASDTFARYLTASNTYGWILSSHDRSESTRVPRYLIPARAAAYEQDTIRNDRFFGMIREATRNATPFPNSSEVLRWKNDNATILRGLVGGS